MHSHAFSLRATSRVPRRRVAFSPSYYEVAFCAWERERAGDASKELGGCAGRGQAQRELLARTVFTRALHADRRLLGTLNIPDQCTVVRFSRGHVILSEPVLGDREVMRELRVRFDA